MLDIGPDWQPCGRIGAFGIEPGRLNRVPPVLHVQFKTAGEESAGFGAQYLNSGGLQCVEGCFGGPSADVQINVQGRQRPHQGTAGNHGTHVFRRGAQLGQPVQKKRHGGGGVFFGMGQTAGSHRLGEQQMGQSADAGRGIENGNPHTGAQEGLQSPGFGFPHDEGPRSHVEVG